MSNCFERVLTDTWAGIYEETYRVGSENFPGMDGPPWHIAKYSLKGGKQHGVDLVEIANGYLTVVVVPTRGMSVLEAFTDEITMGWDSPVRQVVHPSYVDEESRGLLGWLEGFNELVVRCGLASNGAPGEDVIRTNTGAEARVNLPLHGTIANAPASVVSVQVGLEPPYELSVVGEVYDTQMYGASYRLESRISTTPGSAEFTISDVVENLGSMPSELELLYHCNFGKPLLGEGARLAAPVAFLTPRDARAQEDVATWDVYGPPQSGFAEQCHFMRLHAGEDGRTVVALVAPGGEAAATIRYSVRDLPAFTLWKCTAAEADGYVTGLEPGTDYPNNRSFERARGRLMQLPGGGTFATALSFGLVTGAEDMARLTEEIADLSEGKERLITGTPDRDYCPQ